MRPSRCSAFCGNFVGKSFSFVCVRMSLQSPRRCTRRYACPCPLRRCGGRSGQGDGAVWAAGSGSPGRGAALGVGDGSSLPERPRRGPRPLLLALLTQVHVTRASWVRINLYYQVSQTLQKPQPDQGRLVPGAGRAQESQATAEPSILPLQQEAGGRRPGRSPAVSGCLMPHRHSLETKRRWPHFPARGSAAGPAQAYQRDFSHPSQGCCSPC